MDSASISTGSERRGKIRGNRDSSLPIEDWAKGLTRAFSRKKSTSPKSQQPSKLETIPDVPAVSGHNATVFPPRTSSIGSQNYIASPIPESNGPIEDWMKTIPQRKPIPQARNPLRVSLYDRPMTSGTLATTNSGSDTFPIDSSSVPTDWTSDFERELPSPNPYEEDVVDESSSPPPSPVVEDVDKVSPLPSSQGSRECINLTSAPTDVKKASLRSLFFPGSDAKESPRTLSVTSSSVVSRGRPLSICSSIASSVESFTTANDGSDCAIEYEFCEEENNDDTGIDEDYTNKDNTEDVDEVPHVYSEPAFDEKMAQETIMELQNADQNSEAGSDSNMGTLEDILVQVALSSPYASSESDTSSQESLKRDSLSEEIPESPVEAGTDSSMSLPDTDSISTPISVSSEPIQEYRRIRPARHYKLINGIIVQYDPWRVPGQFDMSRYPPQSADGHFDPNASDRSFHQSGNFTSSGNKWSYTGAPVAIAV